MALLLVAIKLLFQHYPGDFPARGQAEAFTWPLIGAVILIGLLGLLAERSLSGEGRFPQPLTDRRRDRTGLLIATATGLAYAGFTIVADAASSGGGNPLDLAEWAHVPWPWSVPFYTFGAIFLELLLRLGALCLLVWLVHVVVLRRRALMPVFWIVNLIVASYEVLPSAMQAAAGGQWLAVAATPLQPLYWTNAFEGWLSLRYGWLTPIVFRLAFYLLWHVVYGGLGPL